MSKEDQELSRGPAEIKENCLGSDTYKPKDVQKILTDFTQNSDFVGSRERQKFFSSSIELSDRIKTELEVSEIVYKGKWVFQGRQPTCLPCSIANASLALGLKPNINCLTELLNLARDEGAKFPETVDIINNHPAININLIRLLWRERLALFYKPKIESVRNFLTQSKDSIVKHNATVIEGNLSQGAILLCGVIPTRFWGEDLGGTSLHTVCITGYRVSALRTVDIQIIDPSCGKIWVSLEHLSSSVATTYRAIRTIN